ncbi:chromosome segregation ATPases [Zymobacter palmae]|uniref:Chromosome segregation ATPases n=1 Tax=Zymobacter palmae TaxID=33074 RepID=A0A348HFV2_9GAMM|nr:chromosome segregation ATPases [Zymobacter palmae]
MQVPLWGAAMTTGNMVTGGVAMASKTIMGAAVGKE